MIVNNAGSLNSTITEADQGLKETNAGRINSEILTIYCDCVLLEIISNSMQEMYPPYMPDMWC